MKRYTHAEWIALPIAEKIKIQLEKQRPPPSRCLLCGVQLMPFDHRSHRARCTGPREPHPGDLWISEADASKRLAPDVLRRLAAAGRVRTKGGRYLLRDVELACDALIFVAS